MFDIKHYYEAHFKSILSLQEFKGNYFWMFQIGNLKTTLLVFFLFRRTEYD